MARTAIAERAAVAYGQGLAGHLVGEAVQAFRALDAAIRRRLTGDRRAENVLSAIEKRPLDDQSLSAFIKELSYYTEVDPDFQDDLDTVMERLDRLIIEKELARDDR